MLEKLEINNVCIACDTCREICPENSIITNNSIYVIDNWSCTRCELCIQVCPVDCIKYETPKNQPKPPHK